MMDNHGNDMTMPEGFEVAELQYRVGQLETVEKKRLADLEDRIICLEEVVGYTQAQRFDKLETRSICVEDVIDHMQSQQITEIEKRLDLLTLELHRLKAKG